MLICNISPSSLYLLLYLLMFVNKIHSTLLKNCECGLANEDLNRIVGGRTMTPHSYPWLVYIMKMKQLHCGGALINDRYVLTAGHCIKWYNKDDLLVVLGRHDRNSDVGIVIAAQETKVHEDFTSDKLHDTNDVALIKLAKSVKFTSTIMPVCLPNPMSEYSNRVAIVAGWGRVSQTGRPARYARRANVQIMPDDFCLQSPIGGHYSDAMICAYSKSIDACQGDSGGPLLYERAPSKVEIIGVVSWGIGCAQTGIPGAYTKLVNYIKWIEDNTLDAVYCSKN